MRRTTLLALLVIAVAAHASAEVPLIPREVLLGDPTRTQARLSPDGKQLSFLAPSPEGVLNVWLRPVAGGEPRQLTRDTRRGIRFQRWAEDGKHLLYLQDEAGDENWHVHAVDVKTGVDRDLTPFEGVRAQQLMADRVRPGEILVALNLRDPRVFDVHRIELASGKVTLDTENPGDVTRWYTDPQFRIRGAESIDGRDGSRELRVRDAPDADWRPLVHWAFEENGGGIDFTPDGRGFVVATSEDADTTRLVRIDLATGESGPDLARHSYADVGRVLIDPASHRIQAVSFDYLRHEWVLLDDSVRGDFEALAKVQRGNLWVTARDHADRRWIVAYERDDGPVAYYLWEREPKQARLLFVNRPELERYPLAPMEPLVIDARDGLPLPSYLTRPLPAKAGEKPKPGPMVLLVHGGPWARDSWGFNPRVQWLANRGYVVLQVNFRGSDGFGRSFLNAGNGQWGVGSMQHDLTDAVRWAVRKGIADPKRVCIYGGSYGGYATLAGLAFTPELYACGVDMVGPSNLKTLLESVPPYWAPSKQRLLRRIGDVENDDALNRRHSPLFHADRMRAPLLIGQGANDPRVKLAESEQIAAALRKQGHPVIYVVYPDEGHGFARPENRLDWNGRVEEFLARHLGGRAEPWRKVPGSTAEVR